MTPPLQDVRVLDLTRLLPGGLLTMLLADMGADVIKIEGPGGGDYARVMPPFIGTVGAFFAVTNRGKRSVSLDLKTERGQAALHKLVQTADVLVESFRPGVMQRLNASYDDLKAIQPGLIYCSLSGWGQDGPYAQREGHDLNYVALSGILHTHPQPLGAQVADIGGALAALGGVTAALFQRERTGAGAYLDTSLFEGALPFGLAGWAASFAGDTAMLSGGLACYNTYKAHDGAWMALAALEPKFWANFCHAVNRPDLIAYHMQPQHQPYLIEELRELFAQRSAAAWFERLDSAECCFSLVQEPSAIIDHPQIQARAALGFDADSGLPWLRSPIRLGPAPVSVRLPGQGEHTREVLREAGLTDAEIDALTQ